MDTLYSHVDGDDVLPPAQQQLSRTFPFYDEINHPRSDADDQNEGLVMDSNKVYTYVILDKEDFVITKKFNQETGNDSIEANNRHLFNITALNDSSSTDPVHMKENDSYGINPIKNTDLEDSSSVDQVHMKENDSYGINPIKNTDLEDSSSVDQVHMKENDSYGINPIKNTALEDSFSTDKVHMKENDSYRINPLNITAKKYSLTDEVHMTQNS